MLSDLYNEKILAFAADIPRLGRLDAPDGTSTQRSRLCGSQVTVDVAMEDGRVSDFAHEVKACALGQASSSIMARHVIGATVEELRQVEREMTAMLKENGPPPTGRFAELACMEPVREHKSRHASTLLTFTATREAAEKATAAKQAA
ncbi:iron-sulfur cluster assembly scaffold protein [Acuticoccus mangrovi]|uniref:Iron-sulfur cluster assembly scaffold protein n=1 Tax=Acuticoccus mangrovi TaxID=2796142 RepID=A0A934IPQ1_9HYPH|nr:iron-sulfur cluster assembly scaffold protein [Acuticoccus mangrovi]MBJ3776318.1 iron-sulfur cluster assembly scaffold protein [Acuticoccus mangrovi]